MISPCHTIDNLPEECSKVPLSNSIGVVTGEKGDNKFCFTLSQSGMDKSEDNTLWSFEETKPPAHSFVRFVAQKTQAVFYMLRGAPVAVTDSGSEIKPLELLAASDFGDNKGLIITGTNVGRNSIPYNLVMTLTCDKEMATGEIKDRTATYDTKTATYHINWTSKSNCGFDLFSFWNKLGWGQYIVEGVLVLGCFVMCFWGFKLYKPSLAIIGFLIGGLATYIFLNLFSTPDAENHWYMWVVLGVSVLLGIVMAVLLVVVEKLSLFGAGAFLGYVGGAELYNLVIFRLDGMGTPVWFYVSVVVLAIVGGLLALWLHDSMIILATAVGGAYLGIKMIGTMIGNYPDETTVAQRIEAGEWEGMPWYNYVYIISQLVLAVAGTVVQCCLKKKSKDEGEDNEQHESGRYEGMV